VAYTSDVEAAARFWELLRFRRHVQLPAEGEPGYVGMTRDGAGELALTHGQWAADLYGLSPGHGPRFEMSVYVADLAATLAPRAREANVEVLRGSGGPHLRPRGHSRAAVAAARLRPAVVDGLDVVSVGVQDECAVVAR
jgi:hypothetical protein